MSSNQFVTLLSRRERDVIDLLLQGKSNKQIALALGISERTVEFHLNNIYAKAHVASRVELILKLEGGKGGNFRNPVESTVEIVDENVDNGNQPTQPRWAQSLRNTVSLIRKEVAMTIRISFEELQNYLKNHPRLFGFLLLLIASLTIRYVVFDLGLYLWVSYILLGAFLGAGSISLGRSWKKIAAGEFRFQPLFLLAMSALLPLIAAGFDQLYIHTILQTGESISTSIANISARAAWTVAPNGQVFRSTHLSITSDLLWFVAIGYMMIFFVVGLFSTRQFKENHLANA